MTIMPVRRRLVNTRSTGKLIPVRRISKKTRSTGKTEAKQEHTKKWSEELL